MGPLLGPDGAIAGAQLSSVDIAPLRAETIVSSTRQVADIIDPLVEGR